MEVPPPSGGGQDSGVETENSNDSSLSSISVNQLNGIPPQNPLPAPPAAPNFLAPPNGQLSSGESSSAAPTPEPAAVAVPPSVTEDGYLGDCSSDGGNEKNFPMPLERINKSCSCHPPTSGVEDASGQNESSPEAPAGLVFQHLTHDACSYQIPSGSGSSSSSRKMKVNHRRITPPNNWMAMKVNLSERKLRIAASMNNVDLAARLLGNGGLNPNASDEHQRTGLHIAAAKGYDGMVKLLLDHGADPNSKDALGNTALHLAACTNHVRVVTLLLRAGTKVTNVDNNGRTPIQLAQSKLKLLQKTQSQEMAEVKNEVAGVLDMMREYLNNTGMDEYNEVLNNFSQRFNLHQTQDDINSDLQNLLDSLGNLSLQKNS